MSNPGDEYRPIPSQPDYWVTRDARIIRLTSWGTWRDRKPQPHNSGYLTMPIYRDRKVKIKLVHRLVAEAWIEAVPGKEYVNHKDGNKLNNHADNLEWCTHLENLIHARKTGLNSMCWSSGESHHRVRHTDAELDAARADVHNGMSRKEAALKHGITYGYLIQVLLNKARPSEQYTAVPVYKQRKK